MSEGTYNDQALIEYLLGSLPAGEAEAFDQLSIADDEFAMALSAREQDLIDAYVGRELSGSVLERFESHYLASPLRREKLEFARALQGWVEKNERDQTAAAEKAERIAKSEPARRSSAFQLFFAQRSAWQWGAVLAVLALLLFGGWFVFDNARLHRQALEARTRRDELWQREQVLQKELEGQRSSNAATEQELARLRAEREQLEQQLKKNQQGSAGSTLGDQSIVSLILAPTLRGTNKIRTVSIPPETKSVTVALQLEAADYPSYRVVLIDPSTRKNLWRSGNLKAISRAGRNTVAVSFPANLLKSQNYMLQVSGVPTNGESEIISDYPFKAVK
jgi:hypothetical protein